MSLSIHVLYTRIVRLSSCVKIIAYTVMQLCSLCIICCIFSLLSLSCVRHQMQEVSYWDTQQSYLWWFIVIMQSHWAHQLIVCVLEMEWCLHVLLTLGDWFGKSLLITLILTPFTLQHNSLLLLHIMRYSISLCTILLERITIHTIQLLLQFMYQSPTMVQQLNAVDNLMPISLKKPLQ